MRRETLEATTFVPVTQVVNIYKPSSNLSQLFARSLSLVLREWPAGQWSLGSCCKLALCLIPLSNNHRTAYQEYHLRGSVICPLPLVPGATPSSGYLSSPWLRNAQLNFPPVCSSCSQGDFSKMQILSFFSTKIFSDCPLPSG